MNNNHYSFSTVTPDITDFFGVLIALWYFISVGYLSGYTMYALWISRPTLRVASVIVAALGMLYMVLYGMDVAGISNVLHNNTSDIPAPSSVRTGTIAALLTISTETLRHYVGRSRIVKR